MSKAQNSGNPDDGLSAPVQNERGYSFSVRTVSFQAACRGTMSWQWRDEIVLCHVAAGLVRCRTGDGDACFRTGESFLINAGILYALSAEEDPFGTRLETVTFAPSLIAEAGTEVYERFVAPPAGSLSLTVLPLNGPEPWQAGVRGLFDEVFRMDPGTYGYELLIRSRLTELWLLVSEHTREECAARVPDSQAVNNARAKKMLAFIQSRYHEELTIDAIAASASISRSECFRCFKRAIGEKPIEYLTEYRVERAIDLLLNTPLSITDICHRCGFSSPSYFGKVFHGLTGQSPRVYRQQMGEDA